MNAVRRLALAALAAAARALTACASRVAADSVQLLHWAPLAPVIVPILFLARAKDH